MNDKALALFYSDRLRAAGLSRRRVLADFAAADGGPGRFGFARALLRRHGMLPTALSRDCRRELLSDDGPAETARRHGNERYKAEDYAAAIGHYTRSALSSEPGTVTHAYALANRSAAMFRTADYRRCADDVLRAVRSGYPAATVHRLYERAGDAERMLGRGRRARRHYAECLRRADDGAAVIADEARRLLRARVAESLAGCGDGDDEEDDDEDGSATTTAEERRTDVGERPSGGGHRNVPALSARLRLEWSPSTGRGVYAACDISPGDVVAVDEPYVSSSVFTCSYSGCLTVTSAGIPCSNCFMAYYCNEDCLQKDIQDGHNLECLIIFSIHTLPGNSKTNALALKWFLKECTKKGIEEYCSVLNNIDKTKIDPKTLGFDENGQFKSDNFLAAYSMRNSTNKRSLKILFFMHCIAVEMLEYIMLSGFIIPDQCVATAGASITHMLSIIDFNCGTTSINNPSITFKNKPLLQIAYALYPSIGLFNHSCDPNVKRSGILSDKTRVLRAIQPIPKGSQLFISYGVLFHKEDKNSRLSYCKDNFKFKCTCQPCIEDWPCGQFIPNRISSLNLLNLKMADIIISECTKFLEFKETTEPDDFHKHLNYLYSFNKLIFTNVKRPFKLYENCLAMLCVAHIKNDPQSLSHFVAFACPNIVNF